MLHFTRVPGRFELSLGCGDLTSTDSRILSGLYKVFQCWLAIVDQNSLVVKCVASLG